jgi:hypothetical protein
MTLWDFIKNIFKKQSPQKARKDKVRSHIEEQLKKEEDIKRKRVEEKKHRERIYNLYNDSALFRDYLIEKQKFNEIYGKNVNCDICGWNCGLEVELYNYNGQTYCERHIPASRQIEHERKVIAGRHGAARNYIKK